MSRSLIFLLFIVCHSFFTFGQYPNYFSYSIENGGPSNEVYCTFQDKQGYIWIGSDAGLYRFNGVNFEQFSSKELTSRAVTGVCETSSGTIFAYNFNNQLIYIKNGKLSVVKNWKEPINHLTADSKGNVWISSMNGLFCFSDKTMTWKEVEDLDNDGKKESFKFVYGVQVAGDGTIYFSVNGKLIERRTKTTNVYNLNLGNSFEPIYITSRSNRPLVFRMISGTIFEPTKKGYQQANYLEFSKLLIGRKLTNSQEIGNDIWVSTYSGIVRYNKITKKAQLLYPQMAFSSVLKDNEGNYWFSTINNGVLRMANLNILCWNYQTNPDFPDQFSYLIAHDKQIYFTTIDGVIGNFKNDLTTIQLTPNNLKSDIGAVYYDEVENSLLFNKMNTIFQYKDGKITLLNSNTHPVKNFYRFKNQYLLATSQGTYLYSTPKNGFKEEKLVMQGWSRDLIKSPFNDHIFIATNTGLVECSLINNEFKQLKTYAHNEQILSLSVNKNELFYLSFNGEVYSLGTNNKPKFLFKMDEQYRMVKMKYKNGKLYLASNLGLLIFDLKTKKKSLITIYDGLSSNNIKDIAFSSNTCWLATGKGLNRLSMSDLNDQNSLGKIVLRQLKVNGKGVHFLDLKQLKFNDNLSLLVDGLSYRSHGNFSFAYRIGKNSEWIKVPNSIEELTIPRLPIGNFVLEVKLVDANGNSSLNVIRLTIAVSAPFWQRWWFYLLIVLSVGAISFLIFKSRVSQLRKKQEQRLRHLKLENELRLTQQNALKAQMNPHFLFNVLNSIKGFIYENDKKNAARYLSDFSNLVRKVLDMSSLPTVPLSDELETVKLYINLESMLLEEDFEFGLEVDEAIDLSAFKIPSLLIQPYIENALKHGLRHKKGNKKLILRVSQTEDVLQIEIEDNGVGRIASAEINQRQSHNHTSFATKANEKRLELLNFEREGFVGVEMEDLIDDLSMCVGTRVTIRINC
jgi:ligand-binding sensor domain-containing protein